jgi:hypothetical protein
LARRESGGFTVELVAKPTDHAIGQWRVATLGDGFLDLDYAPVEVMFLAPFDLGCTFSMRTATSSPSGDVRSPHRAAWLRVLRPLGITSDRT